MSTQIVAVGVLRLHDVSSDVSKCIWGFVSDCSGLVVEAEGLCLEDCAASILEGRSHRQWCSSRCYPTLSAIKLKQEEHTKLLPQHATEATCEHPARECLLKSPTPTPLDRKISQVVQVL